MQYYKDITRLDYSLFDVRAWHYLTSFEGRSSETTEAFNIKGDKFRINYLVDGDRYTGFLTLDVYEEGNSVPVEVIVTDIGFGGEENIILDKGPGTFYLDFEAVNLNRWKVKIADYY